MMDALADAWVGPMPVEDFILAFLPNLKEKPHFDQKFFDILEEKEHESEMYDPFINHVTTNAPDVLDGFSLVNSSQHDDITPPSMKKRPNVSCYKASVVIDPTHAIQYEDLELIFEFKPKSNEADPFEDHPGKKERRNHFPFEAEAESRRLCRGQIASYARDWCARQHRTHCFIVWIADPHARIIRIDRSGGIVSGRFDYRQNGNFLLHFLWSFSHGTDGLRGLDNTVSKASTQEVEEAHEKLYQWRSNSRSVFKVHAPDPNGTTGGTRPFFVWGPLAEPCSVTGRGGRGYVAWDPKDRWLVFLKDSWRSTEPGMEKEVDILKELHEAKCRHVPELVCGDDLDQPTVTKNYADKDWNIGAKKKDLIQRVHFRFVEKYVGSHITSDLKEMNPRKFLQIVFDAFIAHFDAYTKCQILHRDISASNILVDEDGHGFLNDWDLSRHINRDLSPRHAFRSGTWQFMSAGILMNPKKLNTLQDDMESFFWLILYHTLRYVKHNCLENLPENMQSIFDFQNPAALGEEPRGGSNKAMLFMQGYILKPEFEITGHGSLIEFLYASLAHFRAWHTHVLANQHEVMTYARKNKISFDDAQCKLPLQTANFAVVNHEAMMQLFIDALDEGAEWPKGGLFVDRVPTGSHKHRLEEDEEHDSGDEEENADGGEGAPKAKKNQKQKHDDAEYKDRSGTPLHPLGNS